MILPRRRLLRLAAGAAALPPLTRVAAALDAYPSRPIHVVIGFTPGAAADVVARVYAQAAAPILGQQLVVDNKPGAGSSIAAEYVAHSAKDGYTLYLGTLSIITNQIINPNAALDLDPGFRADRAHPERADHSGGQSEEQHQDRQGAHCAVQGEAERGAQFERHRQHAAFRQRAVRASRRHQAHASAVSGQPAGGAGRGRRAHADDVLADLDHRRPDRGRQVAGAGDDDAQRAPARCRTCPPWRKPDCPASRRACGSACFAPIGTPRAIVDKIAVTARQAMHTNGRDGDIAQARRRSARRRPR